MPDAFTHGDLRGHYERIRWQSEALCEPLEIEDYVIQTAPEASPSKWHLAHTSWFFETFILKPNADALPLPYVSFDPDFEYLFNSYYNGVGQQFPRPNRGMLSRPTVKDIYKYRAHVDEHMVDLIDRGVDQGTAELIILGLNHEQQHQELMLTDLKLNLSVNPQFPVYLDKDIPKAQSVDDIEWLTIEEGVQVFGHRGKQLYSNGFHFDNESPAHKVCLYNAEVASRPTSNGEFLEFILDGGYQSPLIWLSDGWAWLNQHSVKHPLYWHNIDGQWFEFTLHGLVPLDLNRPVTHINFYEADAFARWQDCRLPTEFEWEHLALPQNLTGHFVESEVYQPQFISPTKTSNGQQWFGMNWQWTQSSYQSYPGYKPAPGAVGEYNGKFMSGQMVLRGGSCATPKDHFRTTYRNFFYPQERWQFTGIRLARDLFARD